MPKAVADTEPVQKDLKTLPEGFVLLKRMSYGAWLHRRDISMKMGMSMDAKDNTGEGTMGLNTEEVTQYEFAMCIVDHNLEDENGGKLNFANGGGGTNRLDPRIGNEISQYIEELHEFDLGN
jgi:hypothetical protein